MSFLGYILHRSSKKSGIFEAPAASIFKGELNGWQLILHKNMLQKSIKM